MRIAHITDTHLRSHVPGTSPLPERRSREAPALLTAAVDDLAGQRIDAIAVTGDLVDLPEYLVDGMPRGFRPPHDVGLTEAILADYTLIRDILARSGVPVFVVPGNHDDRELLRTVFPRPHDDAGYQVRDPAGSVVRFELFDDEEQTAHVPRRIGDPLRQFLAATEPSQRPGRDAVRQVHLQHYLLNPGFGEDGRLDGYPFVYPEAASLRDRIRRSGRVVATLSGHYHPGLPPLTLDGTGYLVGPAICEYPHPYTVVELDGGEVRTTRHELAPRDRTPRPAVFLDRDGVINDLAVYEFGPDRFRLLPGSASAIRRLNDAGLPVVVVTAQSAIGRGAVTDEVVHAVHEQMNLLLAEQGAQVDAILYTRGAGEETFVPALRDEPDDKAVLIDRAEQLLGLDPSRSWLVGDRATDIDAATRRGVRPILVDTGAGRIERDAVPAGTMTAADLAAAVDTILGGG